MCEVQTTKTLSNTGTAHFFSCINMCAFSADLWLESGKLSKNNVHICFCMHLHLLGPEKAVKPRGRYYLFIIKENSRFCYQNLDLHLFRKKTPRDSLEKINLSTLLTDFICLINRHIFLSSMYM